MVACKQGSQAGNAVVQDHGADSDAHQDDHQSRLPGAAVFDFSPLIAFILLAILRNIVLRIMLRFM